MFPNSENSSVLFIFNKSEANFILKQKQLNFNLSHWFLGHIFGPEG